MHKYLLSLAVCLLIATGYSWAENNAAPADATDPANFKLKFEPAKTSELQADSVSYDQANNKASATGKVVVINGPTTITADKMDLYRGQDQRVEAQGNVYIDAPDLKADAEKAQYNLDNQTGEFTNARVFQGMYQAKGQTISKLKENHLQMQNGFMTTCDLDVPHFCLSARQMDIYPGDRAVARGVKMYLGRVPVMYIPKYSQSLNDKPWFIIIPGYKKDFGAFLLTSIRTKINENAKLTIHADYRERKDFASGFDYKYDTAQTGSGIIRTYYMNERNITSKHLWQERPSPTIERERYKVEWRHKWNPDPDTQILTQYYRVSDSTFIKDYFERQYRADPSTNTYFLLTRVMPKGTLTAQIDASRVNRFERGIERLPEVKYDLNNQQIGDSRFYFKTTDTFSNLTRKDYPTTYSQKTLRFDTNNELSYPTRISFVDFRPYVGERNTYYSRTNTLDRQNVIRNAFRVGTDLSTKFYRVWNVQKDVFGVAINGLRHVITPTVAYLYQHRPTVPYTTLNQFDDIDAIDKAHSIAFGLENKLQTKRKGQAVDLVRFLLTSDFLLKEDPGKPGFGPVKGDIEFKPNNWLTFNADAEYDHKNDTFTTANFDAYISNGEKWSFGIGERYTKDVDNQITTEWMYKLNPKWKFRIYERFLANTGQLKEEEYALTRDLHEWEMDLTYRQERGSGSEFLVVFRLKAFPDMNLDLLSTGFNRPKAGSQSSEGI